MARYPDNYFDLAIVDPPYGIGGKNIGNGGFYDGKKVKGWTAKSPFYNQSIVEWDVIPEKEYFNELFRVSKNQIIWGANHLCENLPISKGWIFWDKQVAEDWSFGDGELAWTSFLGSIKKFTFRYSGMLKGKNGNYREPRIHPTQKPIPLYKWLLDKYAKQGDKILDTHLGSGSIAIACHDYGFDLTACELDRDYFDKAMERINNHVAQQKLF
jgi:site-specific DNA-methyltransferase (adenine-specific)